MILIEATIKYKGYDPNELSYGSSKRVCCACDQCGRVRWVPKYQYRSLCHPCVRKIVSAKTRNKMSVTQTKRYEDPKERLKTGKSIKLAYELNPEYGRLCGERSIKNWKNNDKWRENMSKRFSGENSHMKRPEIVAMFKGENNIMKQPGMKEKHLMIMQQFRGENNSQWQGGISGNRDHVLPINQCNSLNEKFKGSEFHHLTRSYGVYIPKELHRHLYHNMKTNQGMDEMSILSFQFIKGGL